MLVAQVRTNLGLSEMACWLIQKGSTPVGVLLMVMLVIGIQNLAEGKRQLLRSVRKSLGSFIERE